MLKPWKLLKSPFLPRGLGGCTAVVVETARLFESRDQAVTVDAAAVHAQALQTVFGLSALQVQDGVLRHTPNALTQTLFKA